MTVFYIAVAVIAVGVGGVLLLATYQLNKIPKMTFADMLAYVTARKEDAVIAVGVIDNGTAEYTFYGENGKTLERAEHIFEIGSITKTFTASLLFKAISEGRICLDDRIDAYLDLPVKAYYPTIKRIITHTSGYKSIYPEGQIVLNLLKGRNIFHGISNKRLLERIGKIDPEEKDYDFTYSNFGMSVIGAVLARVYGAEYTPLINDYVRTELGLRDTKVSDGSGGLGNYWDWAKNDAYIAAGALTSTIEDMLEYARLHMGNSIGYLVDTHTVISEINANTERNVKLGIRMDAVGAAWLIDSKRGIVWHNGGTGAYNSYIGIDIENQIAVVILSNLPPNYRIPATVIGVKLMDDLRQAID